MQQILIISDSYVDKSEQGTKLLINHLLDLSWQVTTVKQKALIVEPRPGGHLWKLVPTQMLAGGDSALPIAKLGNPEDLADIEEHFDRGIEKILSVIKTSNKVYKPKTYEQAISDFVQARCNVMIMGPADHGFHVI